MTRPPSGRSTSEGAPPIAARHRRRAASRDARRHPPRPQLVPVAARAFPKGSPRTCVLPAATRAPVRLRASWPTVSVAGAHWDLGVIPTPAVPIWPPAARGVRGHVSASHNPPEFNGTSGPDGKKSPPTKRGQRRWRSRPTWPAGAKAVGPPGRRLDFSVHLAAHESLEGLRAADGSHGAAAAFGAPLLVPGGGGRRGGPSRRTQSHWLRRDGDRSLRREVVRRRAHCAWLSTGRRPLRAFRRARAPGRGTSSSPCRPHCAEGGPRRLGRLDGDVEFGARRLLPPGSLGPGAGGRRHRGLERGDYWENSGTSSSAALPPPAISPADRRRPWRLGLGRSLSRVRSPQGSPTHERPRPAPGR